MQWFADAKFGIFIHYGIYAVDGIDESWSFYDGYVSYDHYMQQLKGFTAAAAEAVFPRLTIPRFGFDVEALFIAQKHHLAVRQTAVFFRYDEEPTTVKFAQSAVTMALELLQVRLNDWRGKYV